jgi:hypothetical protein
MKQYLSEVRRMQQLAGLITENDDRAAEQVADKVENSIDSKLDNLQPEKIEQLKAELAKLGITADTPVEDIAQDIESAINEVEGDQKQKIADALDGIGTGLIGSLLVPLIPVAIGSTGVGVAAGFGITLAAAGLLKGLAKALQNK